MIKVQELQHWHLESIKPRVVFKGENIERLHGAIGSDNIFAAALVADEAVVAIIGGRIQWDGLVCCWAITTDLMPRFAKSVHAEVKNVISTAFERFNIRRMEATVRADYEVGRRWLKHLGFEEEALLKKYGPDGSDYILLARFE